MSRWCCPTRTGTAVASDQLQRTVADAIKHEAGIDPGAPSVIGQLAHLAFPVAPGEQGVLAAAGLGAVLVQVPANPAPVRTPR